MTQLTPPRVNTPPTVDLTGHDQSKNTPGTQDTLDSTVSSLQCSFYLEVERANTLRREAAKTNAQSLLDMQTAMNTTQAEMDGKLVRMDETIKTVHEGQKLNDENIQLLMKQFATFSAQIQMMQNVQPSQNNIHSITTAHTIETPTKANTAVQGNTTTETPTFASIPPLNDMEMTDGAAMNVEEFDTIMTDAENKKRWAEANAAEALSKKKKAQNLSPLRRSGRGQ